MLRAAALLAWFSGLGFGLPCIYAIWYLADRGHVWTFLGFPTYGGEPFEGIGFDRRNSPTALAAARPRVPMPCTSAPHSFRSGGDLDILLASESLLRHGSGKKRLSFPVSGMRSR